MKIGVKYCGGCNPHFDRTTVVKQLMKNYNNYIFEYAQIGIEYDILLIVNGCSRSCANYDLLRGSKIITIDSNIENMELKFK